MSNPQELLTISTQNWPTSKKDYVLGVIIGIGGTSTVQAAYCKTRNEKCAIKRIALDKPSRKTNALKEIETVSACNHENIINFYAAFEVNNEYWLVTRLSEEGSLFRIIKRKMRMQDCTHGVFEEATIATVLKEVLKGLEYLHSSQKIHRDITSDNILIFEDGAVQIADFGLCAPLPIDKDSSRKTLIYGYVGTHSWMAPEVIDDSGYDFKADIWSFGITAIEMVTGTVPYENYPPSRITRLTLQNDPPTINSVCSGNCNYKKYGKLIRKMIADCLQKNPAKRPTASELLKHSFFKKAKDNKFIVESLLARAPILELRVLDPEDTNQLNEESCSQLLLL